MQKLFSSKNSFNKPNQTREGIRFFWDLQQVWTLVTLKALSNERKSLRLFLKFISLGAIWHDASLFKEIDVPAPRNYFDTHVSISQFLMVAVVVQ